MQPLIQRADIVRYCRQQGLTVEQLASRLQVSLLTGVPRDQIDVYMRGWRLVCELEQEQQAQDLAQNYTASDRCPHCGGRPSYTGGKFTLTYCPKCHVYRADTRIVSGQPYHRWHPMTS